VIVSYEVGAIFRLADEASPALRTILKQIRELNVALDRARASLATLGRNVVPPGLTAAVAETDRLATAWASVARNATIAQRAIGIGIGNRGRRLREIGPGKSRGSIANTLRWSTSPTSLFASTARPGYHRPSSDSRHTNSHHICRSAVEGEGGQRHHRGDVMTVKNVVIPLEIEYLQEAAKERGISRTRLVRVVMEKF
jgi:hypothetical protein